MEGLDEHLSLGQTKQPHEGTALCGLLRAGVSSRCRGGGSGVGSLTQHRQPSLLEASECNPRQTAPGVALAADAAARICCSELASGSSRLANEQRRLWGEAHQRTIVPYCRGGGYPFARSGGDGSSRAGS